MSATAEPDESLTLRLSAEVERGVYSNLVLINRTTTEFTLDFAYAPPQAQPTVHTRIILTHDTARSVVDALLSQLSGPARRSVVDTLLSQLSGPAR